ncbi:amidase signature enzyme [Coccomyxa subellipsoidea C-169]|uniref:Amidase signature enzyme n=1 Tax=Coccomyxa subellipsoidea (strain C-169) TaxID=574566 RepID=I0Z9M1_COCSC|nr:amidase signature enzyme [Coccomyxa subellipsoidea C-169]EIE27340.1 amidase signature enzyme [Coccomyxa subellipsoidea C-169]|eukprot:XP_005651884.1 amidase signature enzyme [Coccomyxa subellipsoidea C-169]
MPRSYPTAGGTPALEGRMPCNSSTLVTRLVEAHGVVLGKTRMHELAEGVTSINVYGGPVLNPYNNTMHVGGSSGGTTAVVAMRMAAGGFCSDTGGSCRIPASVTGVVGFRPSTGCWPAADGIVPMTVTRDTVGVNSRSVSDVKLFNDIFSDCDKSYKAVKVEGLRIGYPKNFWEDIGEETTGAFDAAIEALKAAGVKLVEMDMSLLVDAGNKLLPDVLFYTYEMPRELSRYLFQHGYNISLVELVDKIASPMVKDAMIQRTYKKLDSYPTPADYTLALDTYLPQLKALWKSYHDIYDVDVLLVPTTPITARPIDDVEPYVSINGRKEDNLEIYGRMNMIDCPLGIPGLSIPVGLAADGMPIGIMLYGRPGADADVLSIGEAIEPLFAVTPPPAEEQQCSGCTPSVKVVNVTWNGVGTPLETDTTSAYTLELAGDCALKSAISAA